MHFLKNALPEKYLFGIFILIAFGSLFPWLGTTPLFDEDEGYFSEVSREMAVSGNYLTAYLNGKPEYDKPVLTYWTQAASFKLFGFNEFAARFPSALATFIWGIAMFIFVRRKIDINTAFCAALFMISAIQMTITGKAAIADALLNLFITLAMFSVFNYFESGKTSALCYAALFTGVGVLTKGPVAVMIPVVVGLLYAIITKKMALWVRAAVSPAAWAIFLAVALPWYVLEYFDQGDAFLKDFFIKHNIERFQSAMEGHYGSFFYYVPVILIGTLPHVWLLFSTLRNFHRFLKKPLLLYCALWFGFIFIFFSLAATKLPHYIIYGYTPVFIFYAVTYLSLKSYRKYIAIGLGVLMIFTILPLCITLIKPLIGDQFALIVIESAGTYFDSYYFLQCGVCIMILASVFRLAKTDRLKIALITACVYLFFINSVLMPRLGGLMQSPVKEAALLARQKNYDIVIYRHTLPSFIFYRQEFVREGEPEIDDIIVTKKTRLKTIKAYETLYEKNGLVMARVLEPRIDTNKHE
jgi:4-amino-4-deoxy-L-arabinose transferase-like glycosyltransferase